MQLGFEQLLSIRQARFRRLLPVLWIALVIVALGVSRAPAQNGPEHAASGSATPPNPPSLMDPAGPQVSLQNSEALFYIAAALNSCGYNQGLDVSDPVRLHIREQIDQALQSSAEARDAHDKLCTYIAQHQLSDSGLNLAQYISLALYTTPPPELTQTVEDSDMPPDSTQVKDILPLLRSFAELIDLHVIWVSNRSHYDRDLAELHDSLSRMIVDTNTYLKMPANTTIGERFLVVVEPLLDPNQTNARVYGSDYVVVVSPVKGTIHMDEVRHTYLHYEIEPLLYARASSMDRLLPFLKIIRDAPLDYTYRSDIVSLVTECMIKAIEARTMDTKVAVETIPADLRLSDLEAATRRRNAALAQAEAVRQQAVQKALLQGYVLTPYFYNQFVRFEKEPQSFKESIGEMVYGMDVEAEVGRVKHVDFVDQSPADVVKREPRQLKGLDLAEASLMKGDSNTAGMLAQKSLDDRAGDPGRANFILARVAIMHADLASAQHDFQETIRLSKDPRMLAWSHIYLGRILDVQNQREQAVTEYQAALTVRDGQADTKLAAERGLKKAYTVPQQTHTEPADDSDSGSPNPADSGSPNASRGSSASGPAQPR